MFAKELTAGQTFTMPTRRSKYATHYTAVRVTYGGPLTTIVYTIDGTRQSEVTVPSMSTVYPV